MKMIQLRILNNLIVINNNKYENKIITIIMKKV